MKTIKTNLSTADFNYIIYMINRYKVLSPVGYSQKEEKDFTYIEEELYKIQHQI